MTNVPYAVELRFDHDLSARVRDLWRTLAEIGAGGFAAEGEAVPHISLAVYEGAIDEAAVSGRIVRLAGRYRAAGVTFAGFGVFPTGENVLFLAPVVTPDLLRIHAGYHALTADLRDACRAYYLPGRWVPHCTLAMLGPMAAVLDGLGHLAAKWTPLDGTLRSIALIRLPLVETLCECPLSPVDTSEVY